MNTNIGDIGFDSPSEFSLSDDSVRKNVGADMSSSMQIDKKGKDILIFGEGPSQRLDGTTFPAEAKYHIDFTQSEKRFVLSLHYNGSNSFLFVNPTKVYQFKAEKSEIKDFALCLSNILKDVTINKLEKQD